MANNFLLISIIIIAGSCSSPKYLPEANKIDVSKFGSYIKVIKRDNDKSVNGELISVDQVKLIVLRQDTKKCEEIPIDNIFSFKLYYAQTKHYGWTIPLFTLVSFMHGYFFIFTTPLNLIGTISVTVNGENAFQYNERYISYDDLNMYARFPQGVPKEVDLKKLKNRYF